MIPFDSTNTRWVAIFFYTFYCSVVSNMWDIAINSSMVWIIQTYKLSNRKMLKHGNMRSGSRPEIITFPGAIVDCQVKKGPNQNTRTDLHLQAHMMNWAAFSIHPRAWISRPQTGWIAPTQNWGRKDSRTMLLVDGRVDVIGGWKRGSGKEIMQIEGNLAKHHDCERWW